MRKITLTALALLWFGSMAAWALAVAEDTKVKLAEAPVAQNTDQSVAGLPSD